MDKQFMFDYVDEKELASKAVQWLNDYFGDSSNKVYKRFPELPILQFDDLLAGDVGDSTSCAIAETIDCALSQALPLGDSFEDIVYVSVDGEILDISVGHDSPPDVSVDLIGTPVQDFLRAFDENLCPSYDRNTRRTQYNG
tara:strand:+ start:357 stop:779 length:423 start_codon:yes stop_codon:yes gene_type:complete